MSTSLTRKFTLKSSDGHAFKIDEAVASQTIKYMIEDDFANNEIPIPTVTSNILAVVIEYCKKHVEVASSEEQKACNEDDLKAWDADFVTANQDMLSGLVSAANYLKIKNLLDLISKAIADTIRDRTSEEIRKIFKIKNDFSPKEKEEIRRENQWNFE